MGGGHTIVIASPPRSLAEARTVPPMASINPRTTVSPRPTPRRDGVAAAGAR